MTFIKPKFRHPDLPKNEMGYSKADYEGAISTLCGGCGHDAISAAIVQACFEISLAPHRLAKLSGIGCSSKTPTYFLGNSHGFNSVHGRMPSIATGASLANKDLVYLGVSGDGDTASIGMGQFVHAVRRNVNMVYIVMNNGCYGLTKGQNSATTDIDSLGKSKAQNHYQAIDLAGLALELGATFVSRSFSGDKTQLIPLIKAAMAHPGFAFIDVLSPCVTFNNTATSTKSYDYVREHLEATATIDFVPSQPPIEVNDHIEGDSKWIKLHDGSQINLHKLAKGWDPTNKTAALQKLQESRSEGSILTGLLYIDANSQDMHHLEQTVDKPLNELGANELNPGMEALSKIMAGYK